MGNLGFEYLAIGGLTLEEAWKCFRGLLKIFKYSLWMYEASYGGWNIASPNPTAMSIDTTALVDSVGIWPIGWDSRKLSEKIMQGLSA